LAGYSVQFQSVSEAAEMPGGPINEDGTFTLYTRVGGKVIAGVKEGTYRATFCSRPWRGVRRPRCSSPGGTSSPRPPISSIRSRRGRPTLPSSWTGPPADPRLIVGADDQAVGAFGEPAECGVVHRVPHRPDAAVTKDELAD